MVAIGGFRSDLSITHKTDGTFGNVSAGVLFSKVTVLKASFGQYVTVLLSERWQR